MFGELSERDTISFYKSREKNNSSIYLSTHPSILPSIHSKNTYFTSTVYHALSQVAERKKAKEANFGGVQRSVVGRYIRQLIIN